ncbi:anti-sigma regulatory factor [Streptomyces sp. SLBN-118]|uniref:ATP-binding protein n=1 Tax=Streptomyces sp. SLBN-118 TaxID=2768454 RepID=UPI001150257C|nr:ATP-binding protein [Streptomyces sp. SLBN-118]
MSSAEHIPEPQRPAEPYGILTGQDHTLRVWRLDGDSRDLSTLRHQVRAVAQEWAADPDAVMEIELVVSELAGNAVRHAGGAYTVTIARQAADGSLVLEVADGSVQMPRTYDAGGDSLVSDSGRGLQIVSACASAWGCRVVGSGKAVWAHFSAPARPAEGSTPLHEGDRGAGLRHDETAWSATPVPGWIGTPQARRPRSLRRRTVAVLLALYRVATPRVGRPVGSGSQIVASDPLTFDTRAI